MADKDSEPNSWRWWRDKYGYEEAIKQYYPETYATDLTIRTAVVQIEASKALIDKIMNERAEAYEDEQE